MLRRLFHTVGLMVFALALQGAEGQSLKVDNTYVYDQGGFTWRVFLDEPPAVLNQIKCVEYKLHPTFPNPTQRRCTPADRFLLVASGWGEFTLLLKIEWQGGKVTTQSYALDLHSPSRNTRNPVAPARRPPNR